MIDERLVQSYCVAAILMPRPMNMAPAARLMMVPVEGFSRNRRPIADAHQTSVKHQRVPVNMNRPPRNRNAATFELDVVLTNCGRNARKKIATFGFSDVRQHAGAINRPRAFDRQFGDAVRVERSNSIRPPR